MTSTPSSSSTPRPSYSREGSSKFKEHLSIYVPPPHYPIESSRFSPESPPTPPPRTLSTWTNTATMRSSTPTRVGRDLEANTIPTPSTTSRAGQSRIARLLFDIRTLVRGDKDPEVVTIQPAPPAWPPLHIEKRGCCQDCPCHKVNKKKKRRNRILIWILIIVLFYLLGNSVALNVRVYGPPANVQVTSNGTSPNSHTLSADAQQCISQYTVNAPTNPSGYPCSTCLSTLQAVPQDVAESNPQNAQQILNAIQFCGLRSIFESADGDGQSALKNGNWAQDVKFCAWNGVSCDGTGRVSSLSLTFPGVPASLPNELGALTGLQTLSVIGNSAIPAGTLPSSFTNWSTLSSVHLESTAMTALPDNMFSSLSKLATFTLVKNGQMGQSLPQSLTGSSLQNLVVNGQNLANPLSTLSSSSSLQSSLKLLDLSSTSLTGIIPSSISSLSSLVELHLDSNSLATPLPTSFPNSLQVLSMSNNSGLTGPVSGSFCTLGSLQKCDMQGTGLSAPNGCGVCQFTQTTSPS